MFKSKLTAEQETRIIKVYLAGNSLGRTGDILGLTIASVLGALERNHVPRRPPSTSGGYKGKPATWVRTPCAECGVLVKRRESEMRQKATGRVFCSEHSTRSKKPRRRKTRACSVCGVEFYPMGLPDQRFCSKRCLGLSQRRRVTTQCETCGGTFESKLSQRQRFCSRSCWSVRKTLRSLSRTHNGRPVVVRNGYAWVWEPTHPKAAHGRVLEHRFVMERHLGRPLATSEHVHHRNRDKLDNGLTNLELLDEFAHSQHHADEGKAERKELAEYRNRFGPLP